MNNFFRKICGENGMIALPTVLLVGGLIGEIVIVAMTTSYILANSELKIRNSADAFFAAKSGIQDGLIRIARDKTFASSYNMNIGDGSAQIVVCKDAPCAANGKDKITSTGTFQGRSRKLEAVATVDSLTGEVRLESLKEVSL